MNQDTIACATEGCPNAAINPAIGLNLCQKCNEGQRSRENANPFSPRGYIGRLGFVMTSIGVWVIVVIAQIVVGSAAESNPIGLGALIAFVVAAAYVLIATAIKRARDAGMTPLTAGGLFIPLLNIGIWLTLAVKPHASEDDQSG